MTTAYTSNLKLALPVTGELDGTWGDTVNDNITSMIEEAITGIATISSWTGASHTLTTANGSSSEARCAVLLLTGAPGAAATVITPATPKLYIVTNNVTGGYAATVKVTGLTGVSVPNGRTMWLYCNGTDIVEGVNYVTALSVGSFSLTTPLAGASGGTGVANTGKTVTLGGNLTTSGAFNTTLTATADTTVTLPTTGTLATRAGTETFTNKIYTDPALGNSNLSGIKTATFNGQGSQAGTSGALTIDWSAAQNYLQAEPVGSITYTFTAPPGICHLQLLIASDGTSAAQTFTWPASVKWLGSVWTATANKNAIINFWYDGTSYWAQGSNQA